MRALNALKSKIEPIGLIAILAILGFILTQDCISCNPIHQTTIGNPFGIPLALYGILFTTMLLWAYFKRLDYYAIGINTAFIVSVALVIAQAFVLKQYCVYCLICESIFTTLWVSRNKNRFPVVAVLLFVIATHGGTDYAVTELMKPQFNYQDTSYMFVGDEKAQGHEDNENYEKREEYRECTEVNSEGNYKEAHKEISEESLNNHYDTEKQIPKIFNVYRWDGKPVIVKDKDVILVSSGCKYCKPKLQEIAERKADVMIIAVWIKDIEKEKVYFKTVPGLKIENIFFDLDNEIAVKSLPTIYR